MYLVHIDYKMNISVFINIEIFHIRFFLANVTIPVKEVSVKK